MMRGSVSEISAPTLVLYPEHTYPGMLQDLDEMRNRLPRAEGATVPGTWTDLMNMEAPEAFNQAMLAFLAHLHGEIV